MTPAWPLTPAMHYALVRGSSHKIWWPKDIAKQIDPYLTPADPYMTFDLNNALCSGTPPLKVPLFNACAVFPNVSSRYYQAWSTPHFWTVRIGYGRVAHSVARILNGKITSENICILKTIFLNFKPMSPRYSGTQGKLRCHCFHCRNLRWGT